MPIKVSSHHQKLHQKSSSELRQSSHEGRREGEEVSFARGCGGEEVRNEA